jgi:hypothetical protein
VLWHLELVPAHLPPPPQVEALRSGLISALIMESSIMSIIDATSCDTTLVGGVFDAIDVVAAFPVGFDNFELLDA